MPVAEAVGDGGLGEGQGGIRIRFAGGAGVQLMAEALLVTTGHQPGAGGAANRTGDVAACEADAVAGERVDVRRCEFAFALGADAGVAEVVGDDEDDVGFGLGGGCETRGQAAEKDSTIYFHG